MYTEFLYTDVEILASVKIFYQNKGLEPYLPKWASVFWTCKGLRICKTVF